MNTRDLIYALKVSIIEPKKGFGVNHRSYPIKVLSSTGLFKFIKKGQNDCCV